MHNIRSSTLLFLVFFSVLLTTIFPSTLFSDEPEEEKSDEGIILNLRNPTYSDGVLVTDEGGVITGPKIRIQATHIRYRKKQEGTEQIIQLEAAGSLIVEFGDYLFVGDKLIYDFTKDEGSIFNGRTCLLPWIFGGEQLDLLADGSYVIFNGYATTSENEIPDWGVYSSHLIIDQDRHLQASQVRVKFLSYPILWIPSLRANLNSIFDTPIRYRFRWGGSQGPRFGIQYELFSWEHWKTFARFDYRLTRGPGGGLETRYRSQDHNTEFHSINYLARDSAIIHPHAKARYRFEGFFRKSMDHDKTKILSSYDKISDKDMPGGYYDDDFDYALSERTQLLIRREEKDWIGNFYTRLRLNSFQTVKQELPSLTVNFKPFSLGETGMILENRTYASYLDFEYSKNLIHFKNYASTRMEYNPTLYRPFTIGRFATITPEVEGIGIVYGNSPEQDTQWLAMGKAAVTLTTQLYKYYTEYKHVIEPYIAYRYYSSPTSSPHQHYIFDIEDGLTRLDYLAMGVKNSVYAKTSDSSVSRILSTHLYTYAFFDQDKMQQSIPRIYGDVVLFTLPTVRQTLEAAWDLEHHSLYHLNFRAEWTVSRDLALTAEYRHRNAYDWRKVDKDNFFLDVFHSERRLFHSALSDQRDTILLLCFYRFHPNWAVEISARQGWNRRHEPKYLEYEIDLLTTLQTAWNIRLSLEHREVVTRFAIYVNVGLRRPDYVPAVSE
jgi:hypothetical protein